MASYRGWQRIRYQSLAFLRLLLSYIPIIHSFLSLPTYDAGTDSTLIATELASLDASSRPGDKNARSGSTLFIYTICSKESLLLGIHGLVIGK